MSLLRNAKIQQTRFQSRLRLIANHDVLGLHVQMIDLHQMRIIKRLRDWQ